MRIVTTVMMASLVLLGCGGEDSSNAPKVCTVNPAFLKIDTPVSSTTSSAGDYVTLVYQENLPSECLGVVSQNSGGVAIRVKAISEQTIGYLRAVNLGASRLETYARDSNSSFESGAMNVYHEYTYANSGGTYTGKAGTSTGGQRGFLLPWTEDVQKAVVTFDMPKAVQIEQYPRGVSVTITALE